MTTESKSSNLIVPVCVRDGEHPAIISFGGVEFHMGLGEMQSILIAAIIDSKRSSPASVDVSTAMHLASEVLGHVTSLSPCGTAREQESNRTRWESTGSGGRSDLAPLEAKLAALRKESATMTGDGYRAARKDFQRRGCKLFGSEMENQT